MQQEEQDTPLPEVKRRISIAQAKALVDTLYADEEQHAPLLSQIEALLFPASEIVDVQAIARAQRDIDCVGIEVWICSNEKNGETLLALIGDTLRAKNIVAKRVDLHTMVVGDWWVVRNNPDGTTQVLVVLEYKDIHDYYKSLNDYRLGDQVTRMMKTNAQIQGIMVGGSINWLQNRDDQERVRKSTLHMQFVDKNLRVFFCPDASHVANDLVSFCKYAAMYADGVEWFTDIPEVHQIKERCKKRVFETQPDVWIVQLNVPGGIGPGKAEAIERKYPSVCHYLAALQQCDTEKQRELLVADIMCPCGKTERRIGDVVSKRLYHTTVPIRKATDTERVFTREPITAVAKAPARRKK